MAQEAKLDMDEFLAEFGVTRREVDTEIKRRLSSNKKRYTSEEVEEHFRRREDF